MEKYGPADFTTIQPALNAAAPGDTVLIGYGRFTEYQTVTLPGWNWAVGVYAYVRTNNLTIIGSGSSGTIIGPVVPSFANFGPKGIVATENITALHVRNLGLENVYDGAFVHGGDGFEGCRFYNCMYGIFYTGTVSLIARQCQFIGSSDGNGIWTNPPARSILVEDCYVQGCGLQFQSSQDVSVLRCHVSGGITGMKFTDQSNGIVSDCTIEGFEGNGIVVTYGPTVDLQRSIVTGGMRSLYVLAGSHVTGSENVCTGATSTVILSSRGYMDMHGNHFLNAGGMSVILDTFLSPPDATLDLSGNYWGTTDGNQIAAWIHDGHDDPAVHGFVKYEPYSGVPLATESASWGEVKTLYGR